MAHLNHRGPEEKGPKTGRMLGLCKLKSDESSEFKLGEGRGLRRHLCDNSRPGKGRRINAFHS
jgi:hypothetical protein